MINKYPPQIPLWLFMTVWCGCLERDSVRGSWKFSSIRSGGEFCWTPGVSLNPLWSADSWAVALCWTSPAPLHPVLNTVMSVWRASSALGVKLIWGTAALHKLSTAAPHNSCQSPALVRRTTSGQILQLLVVNNVFFSLNIRSWVYQAGGFWGRLCREAGGFSQRLMGDSVWWLLGY